MGYSRTLRAVKYRELTKEQEEKRQAIIGKIVELKERMENYKGKKDALYFSNLKYVKRMLTRFRGQQQWFYLKVHRRDQFNQMWNKYE